MNKTNQLPDFMAKGSHGPHVTILHAFLSGIGMGIDKGLIFDAEFGDKTSKFVQDMKRAHGRGLSDDGCFGKETREFAKQHFGLDFEAACGTIPGETVFRSLEGEEIIYDPSFKI